MGVKNVRKKIWFFTLILLLIFILPILPMQATPKQKEDFSLFYKTNITTDFNPVGLSHAGPRKSEGLEYPDQKTYHGRGITQESLFANLNIGTDFSTTSISVVANITFEFNYKTMVAIHKVKTTIMFDDIDGTIEIFVIEKLNYLTFESEGTFVGHGTDALEGVKVGGKSYAELGMMEIETDVWIPVVEITLNGTIMGWE